MSFTETATRVGAGVVVVFAAAALGYWAAGLRDQPIGPIAGQPAGQTAETAVATPATPESATPESATQVPGESTAQGPGESTAQVPAPGEPASGGEGGPRVASASAGDEAAALGSAGGEDPRLRALVPPVLTEALPDLVARLLPAVVNVSVAQAGAARGPRGRVPTALGSGFVIDPAGFIVTNNHVIEDAADIVIIFADGRELEANIVGADKKSDLALLKVESEEPVRFVPWGDSERARIGERVIAIGNPFGLGGTVTEGIISAVHRNIDAGPYDSFIQTDASINRGNSGGPLFNMKGEVIGVNSVILSPTGGSVGIGFSIPSTIAERVTGQIREFGRTRRGWLGVQVQTVTDDIADSLGLDQARGALVANVVEGGPAAASAIKRGDVILSFDGQEIPDMEALPRVVADAAVGRTITVEVWRDGVSLELEVELGELPSDALAAAAEAASAGGDGAAPGAGSAHDKSSADNSSSDSALTADSLNIDSLGLNVMAMSDEDRAAAKLDEGRQGVLIVTVDPQGPAGEAGIEPGDVIVQVNQKDVVTPEHVMEAVAQGVAGGQRTTFLLISRAGDLRFIAVPMKRG